MKIKITAHGITPTIMDCEFNQFAEPHLKERNSANPISIIFVNYSEMEKFQKTRDKCRCKTYSNGRIETLKVERI